MFYAILIGLVSGGLSGYSNKFWSIIVNPVPGFLFAFALILVAWQLHLSSLKWWKLVLFALGSGVAYMAAVWSSFWLSAVGCSFPSGPCNSSEHISLFLGGLVGGLLLALLLRFLIKWINSRAMISLVVFSGVLGIVGGAVLPELGGDDQFYQLYIVWQVGMIALSHYYFMENKTDSDTEIIKPNESI